MQISGPGILQFSQPSLILTILRKNAALKQISSFFLTSQSAHTGVKGFRSLHPGLTLHMQSFNTYPSTNYVQTYPTRIKIMIALRK